MYSHLTGKGLLIPDGFAITASAYRYFIDENKLGDQLAELMKGLDAPGECKTCMVTAKMTNAPINSGFLPKRSDSEPAG